MSCQYVVSFFNTKQITERTKAIVFSLTHEKLILLCNQAATLFIISIDIKPLYPHQHLVFF